MKNPTKWADPNRPICVVLNPSAMPDKASSGPTPPDDSCNKATDRNKAAKEINIRIDFIFPQNAHLHRNEIDKRHVILRRPASMVQKYLGEHEGLVLRTKVATRGSSPSPTSDCASNSKP